jgi:hypothetical protein
MTKPIPQAEFFTMRDRAGPKWVRTYGLDVEGTIYMPAPAVDLPEQKVFMCAAFDGVTVGQCLKHTYYPTWWLKREWPKHKDFLERVEQQIREQHSPDKIEEGN